MAGLPYSGARIRDAGAGEIHDGSLRLRSLSVVLDDWCKDRGKHKGEHEELVNCEQCGKEHTRISAIRSTFHLALAIRRLLFISCPSMLILTSK